VSPTSSRATSGRGGGAPPTRPPATAGGTSSAPPRPRTNASLLRRLRHRLGPHGTGRSRRRHAVPQEVGRLTSGSRSPSGPPQHQPHGLERRVALQQGVHRRLLVRPRAAHRHRTDDQLVDAFYQATNGKWYTSGAGPPRATRRRRPAGGAHQRAERPLDLPLLQPQPGAGRFHRRVPES
jgi:hypothetical protein